MATISIKDKPILASQEDLLNINKYAQALVHFILNSDTPITIGLQGEWGTGKDIDDVSVERGITSQICGYVMGEYLGVQHV